MNTLEYNASATKHRFWFAEFQKIMELLLSGLSPDEINAKNAAENILGGSSVERSKYILGTVFKRINSLGTAFYSVFQKADVGTRKLIALIAIMRVDRLFFEFIHEVYKEKLLIGDKKLEDSDFRIFFKDKQIQSEKVAGWTDASLNRLARTYKSYLMESGLVSREKKEKTILRPIIDVELEHTLNEQGMNAFVDALTGVR